MHGWIIINKPVGPTSFDIIRQIRRVFPKTKCGHAGTLDPLASGVLPIALGEATKVISFLMDAQKTYRYTVSWGEQRTTDDQEGEIMATSSVRPTQKDIENILPDFQGALMQTPPLYSALKINGIRACDRMRNHENIQLAPRPVIIKTLRLLNCSDSQASFETTCSKGTYVRSLARDMARALGTLGYASMIHRSQVGPFQEDYTISLEKLALGSQKGVLEDYIQPLEAVLDDILAVRGNQQASQAFRQGQNVALDKVTICRGAPDEARPVLIYSETGEPLAIAQFRQGQLWPKRIFNIES